MKAQIASLCCIKNLNEGPTIFMNNKDAIIFSIKEDFSFLSGKIPFHTRCKHWQLFAKYAGSETVPWTSLLCIFYFVFLGISPL